MLSLQHRALGDRYKAVLNPERRLRGERRGAGESGVRVAATPGRVFGIRYTIGTGSALASSRQFLPLFRSSSLRVRLTVTLHLDPLRARSPPRAQLTAAPVSRQHSSPCCFAPYSLTRPGFSETPDPDKVLLHRPDARTHASCAVSVLRSERCQSTLSCRVCRSATRQLGMRSCEGPSFRCLGLLASVGLLPAPRPRHSVLSLSVSQSLH